MRTGTPHSQGFAAMKMKTLLLTVLATVHASCADRQEKGRLLDRVRQLDLILSERQARVLEAERLSAQLQTLDADLRASGFVSELNPGEAERQVDELRLPSGITVEYRGVTPIDAERFDLEVVFLQDDDTGALGRVASSVVSRFASGEVRTLSIDDKRASVGLRLRRASGLVSAAQPLKGSTPVSEVTAPPSESLEALRERIALRERQIAQSDRVLAQLAAWERRKAELVGRLARLNMARRRAELIEALFGVEALLRAGELSFEGTVTKVSGERSARSSRTTVPTSVTATWRVDGWVETGRRVTFTAQLLESATSQ